MMAIEGAPRANEMGSGMRRTLNRPGDQLPEVGRKPGRVDGHVLPGDADDSPTGEREEAVALAVGVEAAAGRVSGAAVELDDELWLWPDAVGPDPAARR